MTTVVIPTMVVDSVELRVRPSIVPFKHHPVSCDHAWEPHLWSNGRAYCARCGSQARWVNDPRLDAS